MTTYFICNTDSYGQRTGSYSSIQLSEGEVNIDSYGNKIHGGKFLYESELEIMRACQG